MNKTNKLLILISSLISIYAIIGFIALPKILKPQIEKTINENLSQSASIGKIDFNPFLLKFTIHDVKVYDENETTISAKKLFIDLSLFQSFDERHISFRDLELLNPQINIIEYEDGTLNLQKLLVEKEKKEEKTKKKDSKSNIKFQIYRTILNDAKIRFVKHIKDEKPFVLNIDKLNYTFYDMGTFRNELASHTLRILVNKNSELIIKGGLRLDPFKMHGNVEFKNFKPYDFLTYKKDILNFDLNQDSYFDLKFGYKVDASKALKLEVNDLNFSLNNLDIKQKEESILALKNLAIDNLNLHYPQNLVLIDAININELTSKVIINKDEQLNFSSLLKSEQEQKEEVQGKKEVQSEEKLNKIEDTKVVQEEKQEIIKEVKKDDKKSSSNIEVVLKELNIKNSNITFNDLKNALFVDTKNINIDLSTFKLKNNDFTLDKLALSKPSISIKDNKNKISIENKELNVLLSKLSSKDSIINIDTLEVKDKNILFKDLKNALKVSTKDFTLSLAKILKDDKISLESLKIDSTAINFNDNKNKTELSTGKVLLALSTFLQEKENINIDKITLSTPKLTFKDNKNKLHVFTKKNTINLSKIDKKDKKISLNSIDLKSPSIFVRDYKNSLKILTNSLSVNLSSLNLNDSNMNLKKLLVKTPSVKFNNLDSKVDITTKNINISALNTSLVKEKLKVALVSLSNPSIYMVDNKKDTTLIAKKIKVKVNNLVNNKGAIYVSKVKINEPNLTFKDKTNKMDVLAKNIALNVNKISYKNNLLKIVNSSVNKPYIALTLGKKAQEEKSEPIKEVVKAPKKKSDFKFDIGPVKIDKMKMSFEDKNLPIPFSTDISQLNGKFSRLNSSSSKPTKLELEGKVDEYGYTKITGIVDINDIKLLTDTNLLFKNIAIKNFTPYSGKFVGREIDNGKLDLDLKYNIKKSDLSAQNTIVISNIKLGKKVQSPDAADLPLELAIALLEDSNGVIDLELPVSGNIDDPQFSIAPIVWKVFTNLIVKAITAPFSLLAAVFGVDEESIKSIEFEYGKSEILVSEKESLDNITKILAKKPKLAINIKPSYDPIKDKLALQDIKFDKFLEKTMKKIPEGDEYKEALEKLYIKSEKKKLEDLIKSFTKKDKKGKEIFDNDSYVEHIRKLLASKQKVSDKELINLSKLRIENIKKYLLVDKKVNKNALQIEEISKQDKKDAKWAIFNLDVAVKK